jgi:hypothetical protein
MTDADAMAGPAGLDEAYTLVELGAARVPLGGGLGAGPEEAPSAERLLEEILSGEARLVELPGIPALEGVKLRWWHRLARVLLVVQLSLPVGAAGGAGLAAISRSGDAIEVASDLLVIGAEGRAGEVGLRLRDRDLVLRREETPDGVLDRLLERRPRAYAGLRSATGAAGAIIASPDVDALLSGAPIAPWLRRRADRLAAQDSSDSRLAAVGCLARLWCAPAGTPIAIEPIPIGDSGLRPRIERWLRALDERACAGVERSAIVEALAVQEELERPPLDDEARALHARAMIDRRDDLESIRWSLTMLGHGERLEQVLVGLDATAEDHLGDFEGLVENDEHLDTVSWQEIDAWWGSVGLPA